MAIIAIPYSSLTKNATVIASTNIAGGEFVTNIGAHWLTLYRSKNGRYFIAQEYGPGANNYGEEYLTDEQAVNWISTVAEDPVTGYGYTPEQAEKMIEGDDAGRGYRGQ